MTPTKPICFPIYEMREVSHMVSEAPSMPTAARCLSPKAGFLFSPRVSWGSELPRARTCIHQLPEVRDCLVQL